MLPAAALLASVAICLASATIEALCAGRHVRPFFDSTRFPRYSAPLWLWSIIGGGYYLIFGFMLYRLLRHVPAGALLWATISLVGAMMLGNALTNLVIFRRRNLRPSRTIGNVYGLLDVILVVLVARLDTVAAWALAPYLAYRVYAVWWGFALVRLNTAEAEPTDQK